jgi:hypothetical protein
MAHEGRSLRGIGDAAAGHVAAGFAVAFCRAGYDFVIGHMLAQRLH